MFVYHVLPQLYFDFKILIADKESQETLFGIQNELLYREKIGRWSVLDFKTENKLREGVHITHCLYNFLWDPTITVTSFTTVSTVSTCTTVSTVTIVSSTTTVIILSVNVTFH